MKVSSIYPVLMTDDVARTASFYRDHFEFEVTFEADWYVSLKHGSWELAILAVGHPTIPVGHSGAAATGILLNVEVDDVDAVYDKLVTSGPLEAVLSLRSETFGQRHFIVAAPDGVLVDVITEIPPAEEYAEAFQ